MLTKEGTLKLKNTVHKMTGVGGVEGAEWNLAPLLE